MSGRAALALALSAALAATVAAAGVEADSYSEELHEIGLLFERGKLAAAERRERALLRRGRSALGGSESYLRILEAAIQTRIDARRVTPETLGLVFAALDLAESVEEGPSEAMGEMLHTLGWLFHVGGDLAAAEETYQAAFDVRMRLFGARHIDTARSLTGVASVVSETDYGRASKLMEEALATVRELFGEDDERYADRLLVLGIIQYDNSDFEAAAATWTRVLEVYERRGNVESAARIQQNLGLAYQRLGDLARAEEFLGLALTTRLRSNPDGGPGREVANTYRALGDLELEAGNHARAREYYEAALPGLREWFDEDPYRYAGCLSRLGDVMVKSGAPAEALALQEEALRIRRSALGADHHLVGVNLQRLGEARRAAGFPKRARRDLQEALAILRSSGGSHRVSAVPALVSLAQLAVERGRGRRADEFLEEALRILEAADAPDHERIAPTLELAALRRGAGELGAAADLVESALRWSEATYGPGSPRNLAALSERASLLLATGDAAAALEASLEAERSRRSHVESTVRSLPEREALAFSQLEGSELDVALTILDRWRGAGLGEAALRVWQSIARSRGLVLDAMSSRQRLLAGRSDPRLEELGERVFEARLRVAGLQIRGGATLSSAASTAMKQARRELAGAERDLARATRSLLPPEGQGGDRAARLTGELPHGTAVLGFWRYRRHSATPAGSSEPRYGLFVRRFDRRHPHYLALGAAAPIERAIAEWNAAAADGLSATPEEEDRFRALGQRVRELVWSPLEPHLAGIQRLLVVPDGALHFVSFGALPAADGRYQVELGRELQLLSGEGAAAPEAPQAPRGEGLLAFGGPDYWTPTNDPSPPTTVRGWQGCRRFAGHRFDPLPRARDEAARVSRIWEGLDGDPAAPAARVLVGAAATESAFRRLSSGKRALHLATHGFFLEDDCGRRSPGRGRGSSPGGTGGLGLAGLALAGANRRLEAPPQDDGIITSIEISALDLSGVEWAVLSACDTGLGPIQDAEGVFGLPRAFAIAGVRTVITSLWVVDDEAATAWMGRLYERRFIHGDTPAGAVHRASLDTLRALRADNRSTHPIYWGAFVATGSWEQRPDRPGP